MSNPPDDQRLRDLLHEAVEPVRPGDRLGDIRRRTTSRPARRWWPVVLAAGAATAAVVAASVVITQLGASDDPPPAASSAIPSRTASVPVYFVGDSPTGPRLFREFQQVATSTDEGEAISAALQEVINGPDDPDYRTSWPGSSFVEVAVDDERITVTLDDQTTARPSNFGDIPVALAQQQVVYTAQAVLGASLPVRFIDSAGQPINRLLGAIGEADVSRDRQYDVVTPVNISDPSEGMIADDVLIARGFASDQVNQVTWSLRQGGRRAIDEGVVQPRTDGQGAPEFRGWETTPIDLDGLEPGRYLFTASTQIVGQTTDTPATFIDTRTIVVR